MSNSQVDGAGMQYEIRLYGLHPSITSEQLIAFFSFGVRVLGATLHPGQEGLQWAKIWVGSERDVTSCLEKKLKLAENGITITRAPTQPGWVTPDSLRKAALPPVPLNSPMRIDEPITTRYRSTSSVIIPRTRTESGGLGYRHVDPSGPLPRNLYVMGLPLDMTQIQFKSLFEDYGMVEHSILLSQLDSMGRRRGFVLMSTHREALGALNGMNERYIEGLKIDVSWALRQKQAEQIGPGITGLGNKVLHPPTTPVRRETSNECSVVCDNLDPAYFPHIERLREVLEVYGPIHRVTLLSARPSLKVLVQFEHSISAQALIGSSGSSIAGRPIMTYPYSPMISSPGLIMTPSTAIMTPLSHPRPMMATTESIPKAFQFDPFQESGAHYESPSQSSPSGRLTATSRPFVPPALSLSSLSISGSGSGSGPGSGSGSSTKVRMASGETFGSSALSRISSRSTSAGQTTHSTSNSNSNSISNSQVPSHSGLTTEQRLAEIWH